MYKSCRDSGGGTCKRMHIFHPHWELSVKHNWTEQQWSVPSCELYMTHHTEKNSYNNYKKFRLSSWPILGFDTCMINNELSILCLFFFPIQCWETFIGQQFFRLALTNLFISIASTIVIETGRKWAYSNRMSAVHHNYYYYGLIFPFHFFNLVFSSLLVLLHMLSKGSNTKPLVHYLEK